MTANKITTEDETKMKMKREGKVFYSESGLFGMG